MHDFLKKYSKFRFFLLLPGFMFFSCATLYKTSMDSEIPEFSVLEISSNGWDGDENTDIKIPSSGDYDEFDEFEAAEKNRAIEKNEGVEISK